MRIHLLSIIITLGLALATHAELHEERFIFTPAEETPEHVHASCIVECPNGDLMAVWYENGTPLPEPYYSGNSDKSDDVRLGAARLRKGGSTWEDPFVMIDTFGVSDNNPCMAIGKDNKLWLVHATLIGVPENTWGSALVQYRIATDYMGEGVPDWDVEQVLIPHPTGVIEAMKNALPVRMQQKENIEETLKKRLEDPLVWRLGWMPRAHPIQLRNGTMLIPLANENYYVVNMAMTMDNGKTWTISEAVPFAGLEQPTVAEAPDGTLLAFFRSSDDEPRIRRSESKDGGMTWTKPTLTDLVHPFSGLEIVYLQNGTLALIYNDKADARDTLTVALSNDHGKTWPHARRLEDTPGGRFDYPSLVQGADGTLHAAYSYNLKTVKHVHFDEAWIKGE